MSKKQDAFNLVVEAAGIHAERMKESLTEYNPNPSFNSARNNYVRRLRSAMTEVAGTRFDDAGKVSERVRDLDLAESVSLLHAVEDHIRNISGRSPLA